MNKLFCLILPVLMLACIAKHDSKAQKVTVYPKVEWSVQKETDTLKINLQDSNIAWKATEMWGAKSRRGTLSFEDGFFLTVDGQMVGGGFKVNMETMDVTDIPIHETIARKNLLDHLKSDDFLNVAHYNSATMNFVNVQKTTNDSLKISGNLQIREVTKNIEFMAYFKDSLFRTGFTFNRLDWNIAYEGSWADKTLVDKEVELAIEIFTE